MRLSRAAACGLGLHLACLAAAPSGETAPPALVHVTEAEPTAPRGEAAPSNVHVLKLGAARLRVVFEGPAFDLGSTALLRWVERSARAVEAYYGVFPVSAADVKVRAFEGHGMRGGRVLPIAHPTVAIDVGIHSVQTHLERNWSMTHELVHLAFPNVARSHHWLEEGLASYVEPMARARVGWLSEDAVWKEWLENLHQGLPEEGDRGLDHTATWGRTYWGGALYCFLADLEIRRRTQGRHELRDALRGILARGGNITQRWPVERALRAGDEATGTAVLEELYRDMKDKPVHTDLQQLWRELGVSLQGGAVRYDDSAPLAGIRKRWVLGR
jgi:hypothetical protein